MGWTFLYLFVVLKIPLAFAIWLVWYASRPPEEAGDDEARDNEGPRRPRHPRPGHPLSPRRGGPHGAPAPTPPARVRTTARARRRVGG